MTQYAINVINQHDAIHNLFEVNSLSEVKILDNYLDIINNLENWCYSIPDLKKILNHSYRFLHIPKKSFTNPNFNWDLNEDIQRLIELVWTKLNNDKRINYNVYEINYRNLKDDLYIYDSEKKPIKIYNYLNTYIINI